MTRFSQVSFGGGTVYTERLFAGFRGLNNKYSNEEIPDNELPDLLNIEFDDVGAIVNRNGFVLVKNFGATPIKSILPFITATGTRVLLVTYGTTITQYNPQSGATVPVTSTLTGNGQRFTSALDTVHNKIYMVNGNTTDGLMSWDGTTFAKVAGAQNGKYLLFYKNRMYLAGDPANPNRLYMSDLGDPTSWPALNFIDYDDGVGGLTGLAQLGDSINIFKEIGVFILKGSGPSDYVTITTYSGERGTVSHWTIVRVPNGLIFLARDGVWLFNGHTYTLLSDKIYGSVQKWNQQFLSNAVAIEYENKYWLSVPEGVGQPTNNYTYLYNYLFKWWTRYDMAMQANVVSTTTQLQPNPYFADLSGNLMQADQGTTDNDQAIRYYFETKEYDFGASAHFKQFKRIAFDALAQAGTYFLTLTFIQDFGKNSKSVQMPLSSAVPTIFGNVKFGQVKFGGQGEIAHLSTAMPGQSRYLKFRMDITGKDTPFTILRWVVQYKTKRRIV
jgi:hypothetical protein